MTEDRRDRGSVDPVWENKYRDGHAENYPWDVVVSFVFRNAPRDRPRSEIRILEVGFGTGSNLWFAAREGFDVAGIEASPSAVAYAQDRFAREQLKGDLRRGDFTTLPFADESFDLVIDRGSLVCVGNRAQHKAISEIHRVLRRHGRFLYNGYADSHSSYRAGEPGADGVTLNITAGTLTGVGQLHFVSRSELDELFANGWELIQVQRREWTEMLEAAGGIHSEWVVVAEKR